MNTAINLTLAETELVKDMVAELFRDSDGEGDLNDIIKNKLDMTDEEAAKAVEDLKKGVHDFHAAYEGGVNTQWISDKLDEVTADMDDKEKYQTMVNVLVALSGISTGDAQLDTERRNTALEYRLEPEKAESITQYDINELNAVVSEMIEASAVKLLDNERTVEMLEACAKKTPEEISQIAWGGREAGLHMAAAVFILQRQGMLSSLPEDMTPVEIGVCAAANIESDSAVKQGAAGKLSWDTVKDLLKTIAIVSLTLIVGYAVAKLIIVTSGIVFILTNAILGFGVIGTIIALAAGFISAKGIAEAFIDVYTKALKWGAKVLDIGMDKVRDGYTAVTDWVKETAMPKARLILDKCIKFVNQKVLGPVKAAGENAVDNMTEVINNFVEEDEEPNKNTVLA